MNEVLAMYGLSQYPFMKETIIKDPFESRDFKQVSNRIKYMISSRGVGVIVGSPGSGKTYAVRCNMNRLNAAMYKIIYIELTTLSPIQFYRQLAEKLGYEPAYSKNVVYRQVKEGISNLMRNQRIQPIIIIDEAQDLKIEVLNEFKSLLNFDMDSTSNMTLMLMGTEMLGHKLNREILSPLRQRIVVNYQFCGLDEDEVKPYVEYRLKVSGRTAPLFTDNAINAAYANSGNSIRSLNKLLTDALVQGVNCQKELITEEEIFKAVEMESIL